MIRRELSTLRHDAHTHHTRDGIIYTARRTAGQTRPSRHAEGMQRGSRPHSSERGFERERNDRPRKSGNLADTGHLAAGSLRHTSRSPSRSNTSARDARPRGLCSNSPLQRPANQRPAWPMPLPRAVLYTQAQ